MLTIKRHALTPWQLALSFISIISICLVAHFYIANPTLDTALMFAISLFCAVNIVILSLNLFQLLSTTPRIRHLTKCVKRWTDGDLNITNRIGEYGSHGELSRLEFELNHMLTYLHDNSNKKREDLQSTLSQNHFLSNVLHCAPTAIYVVDDSNSCIFANDHCVNALGYRNEWHLIESNQNCATAYLFDDTQTSNELMQQPDAVHLTESHFTRADGSSLSVEYSAHSITLNDNKAGIVVAFYDARQRLEIDSLIRHQTHYDTLTDLPNRFLSLNRLESLVDSAKQSGQQFAVIFLDLDDFKKINDSLGHETGDQLLIAAAERITKTTQKEDAIGRLGGDEFIILLEGLSNANEVNSLAEKLVNCFRKPFFLGDRQLILTASIGIAIYPNDGRTASELLRNADSAMYHSKGIGRNTYSYFTHAMTKEVYRRLAIEEQIHGALKRKELQVHYQVQLDISKGTIIGAEALLRWNNPALGSISPAEFIPIAEQTGVIESMGEFVLQQALQTAKAWQNMFNDDFRVAINLSPRQFRSANLVPFILDAVHQHGMQPKDLELEITEGVLLCGHTDTLDALKALSQAGFCISMDDFGTGYSSLDYLRTYPFQVLKIDRSFVKDMNNDNTSKELIIAAIEMAHALGIRVVAEGVETQEQFDELSFMMCDYAQGFLISKPVAVDALIEIGSRYNNNSTAIKMADENHRADSGS